MYYVHMAAAWYLSMAAKHNTEEFDKHFNSLVMDERLLLLTLRKIRESRQFTAEEKEKYRKMIEIVDFT